MLLQHYRSSSLNEHLEITGNDTDVYVFHVASILDLYEGSSKVNIFPDSFIQETCRTLSLLLPVADDNAISWTSDEQEKYHLDHTIVNSPHLKASRAKRPRLQILGEQTRHPEGSFR